MLRAVLLAHYGGTPEGLTEAARATVTEASASIGPEDAVRMLKMLGDSEMALRRSANPRIALEMLLLRWAMMDRAVEIQAMLRGDGPSASAASPAPRAAPQQARSAAPRTMQEARPVPSAAAPVAPIPEEAPPVAGGPAFSVPETTESLRAVWPEIVAAANRQSRLLGQALSHAVPQLGEPGTVVLEFGPDSAVFQEGIERQLATVETAVSARMGRPVAVRVQAAGSAPARPANRLSEKDMKADRLRQLRGQDPALDAAADALDLELVDEG
jgi:DNA polymerase-3 subunit gamma/tau